MKNIRYITVIALTFMASMLTGCFSETDEPDFSENYDIPWIVSEISNVNPLTGAPGSQITITGTNLGEDMVQQSGIKIGTMECEIVSQSATSLVVKVPSLLDPTPVEVSVKNLHHRTFVYPEKFTPQMQ